MRKDRVSVRKDMRKDRVSVRKDMRKDTVSMRKVMANRIPRFPRVPESLGSLGFQCLPVFSDSDVDWFPRVPRMPWYSRIPAHPRKHAKSASRRKQRYFAFWRGFASEGKLYTPRQKNRVEVPSRANGEGLAIDQVVDLSLTAKFGALGYQ